MGQSKRAMYEAATLILLSRSSQKVSNSTNNFQVLMVQRSSRSSFMVRSKFMKSILSMHNNCADRDHYN